MHQLLAHAAVSSRWNRRYANDGFMIVGVHTPEFKFSGQSSNVAAASKRLGVTWPVALDDDHAIWDRYQNRIWPHEFLYDQNGRLVESVEGEGNYPQTEAKIQELLKKQRSLTARACGDGVAAARQSTISPERFAIRIRRRSWSEPETGEQSPTSARSWIRQATTISPIPAITATARSTFRVFGGWRRKRVVSSGGDGYAALNYRAIQVVSVMMPSDAGSTRVGVMQDGKPVAAQDAGADIHYDSHGNSYVQVDAPREYDLVMNKHYAPHELRLEPGGAGLGIYSFDFESCEAGTDK